MNKIKKQIKQNKLYIYSWDWPKKGRNDMYNLTFLNNKFKCTFKCNLICEENNENVSPSKNFKRKENVFIVYDCNAKW